jgi:hypothetical protein
MMKNMLGAKRKGKTEKEKNSGSHTRDHGQEKRV